MPDSDDIGLADQAAGLRRLFKTKSARAIAFVSGREACGRTKLLVRTATALAQAGEAVVIIDENAGTDNVHSAFGLKSRNDLLDLADRPCSVDSLVQGAAPRLGVMAAVRFAAVARDLGAAAARRLDHALKTLQESHSYVLVDCADGSGQHLSPLALAAPCMAVVVAAQSSAITRAYALIKRLVHESGRDAFQVVITRARSEQEAMAIFQNMRQTAHDHLGVRLDYLGSAHQPLTDHIAVSLRTRLSHGTVTESGVGFLPLQRRAMPRQTHSSAASL